MSSEDRFPVSIRVSAHLHSRCSRAEDRAAPRNELSDSRQTFEGAVRTGRAHRWRCDLSDALGAERSGIAKHIEGFPCATMPGEYLRSINSGGSEVAALIR